MKLRLRILGGLVDLKLTTSGTQHDGGGPVDGPPFGFSGGPGFDTERDEPEGDWHG